MLNYMKDALLADKNEAENMKNRQVFEAENVNSKETQYSMRDSKTILFSSPNGGCGCSFLANTVAAYLSLKKNKNIVLLDLNAGKKDSRIIFGLTGGSTRDAGDIKCGMHEIDLHVLKKIVINLESSLNIVLPALSFEENSLSGNENIRIFIEALSAYFDLIIIDFPFYLFLGDCNSLLERIDRLVFVSQPSLISISNLNVLLNNIYIESMQSMCEIIINKFNTRPSLNPARINSVLGFPVKTFMPYDKDIEFLYTSRGPFPIFNYNLRIIKAISELGESLYEELFN